MDGHDAKWLGAGIEPTRIFCLIAGTILVFDYLCTLDREVNLIWKRRLGGSATMLFLLNRYIPYLYVFMALEEYWLFARSQDACRHRDIANVVVLSVGITTSEVILALRTWAIWMRSRMILVILGVLACIKAPLIILAVCHLLKEAHYINISPAEVVCISPVLKRWSWETLVFMVIMMIETSIAGLTLIKAVEARHYSSMWFFKIHYMGIIYYLYNFLMAISNLIATTLVHNMGIVSFALFQGVLQSLLCSRVIFLAREPSELGIGPCDTFTLTQLETFNKEIGQPILPASWEMKFRKYDQQA